MLCFGNFRFAYKQLIRKDAEEMKTSRLSKYCKNEKIVLELSNRPEKLVKTKLIDRDKTWYVGETTGKRLEREGRILEEELTKGAKGKSSYELDELLKYNHLFVKMTEDAEEIQQQALRNTYVYLTWDYLDIYIATSMRFRWEFEDTFDFIQEVFNHSDISDLKLRYFDPTQSKCKNSRDKGLVEGLMLKRANFTIYLAQESDTMGKDSEMAATLVQNKPVIAFVPKYSSSVYAEKIESYPLEYFWNRLPLLKSQLLKDPDLTDELEQTFDNYYEKIDDFLDELEAHLGIFPLSFHFEREKEFKKNSKEFKTICQLLAISEIRNFDRRAALLAGIHPLSMQIDLQTGVANGVLVVRDSKKCSQLIRKLVTNDLSFKIEHKKEGFTQLKEEISGCPFRVVTDDEKLTNSFWNFFL